MDILKPINNYKKTLLIGSLFISLLIIIFLFNAKAGAFNPLTDAEAQNVLSNRCLSLPPSTQTIHIIYLEQSTFTQTNDTVVVYLKGMSHRCSTASGTATNVGQRLDSTTTQSGGSTNNITAPSTYYSGVSVPVGGFTSPVRRGPFTISTVSAGQNIIRYDYTAYSFSSSGAGWDFISFNAGDVCLNIPGLQWPGPPAGYVQSGVNCIVPVGGCTDSTALNYNSSATFNDGSCVYNSAPTGSISAICVPNPGLTTGTVTVSYNITDINGDNLTITHNGGAGASESSNTGSTTSRTGNFTTTFSASRQLANQSVSGTVSDGIAASVSMGSATFNCPPPDNPIVTIDSGSTCDNLLFSFTGESFNYTAELLIDNASASPAITKVNQSSGSTLGFSEVALYKDFVGHNFSVKVTNSSFSSVNSTSSNIFIGPCASVTCNFTPASIEVGSVFNAQLTIVISNYGSRGSAQTVTANLSANFPTAITSQPMNPAAGYVLPGPISLQFDYGPVTAPTTAGVYSITTTVSGLGAVNCPGGGVFSLPVFYTPYLRLYGNDVLACGGDVRANGGGLPGPSTYLGAASQLAVFATGQISGLMSGSQNTSRTNPWDLSFANDDSTTTDDTSLRFGGLFASCPIGSDYNVTAGGTTNNINPSLTPGTYVYEWDGGSDITGRIPNGVKLVIHVSGDISIKKQGGGVVGPGVVYDNTSWASIDEIPSFTLIVDGNIYVQDNVEQIDGHYIAGGNIYTCTLHTGFGNEDLTSASGNSDIAVNIINDCDNKLTVNGSFKAKKIHFLRSNGTATSGSAYEPYTSGNIAEVFRFSPEIYLTNDSGVGSNISNRYKFDSIVSRPPAY
jgi:hypothetical protein